MGAFLKIIKTCVISSSGSGERDDSSLLGRYAMSAGK
jgi:hypothetical protein